MQNYNLIIIIKNNIELQPDYNNKNNIGLPPNNRTITYSIELHANYY